MTAVLKKENERTMNTIIKKTIAFRIYNDVLPISADIEADTEWSEDAETFIDIDLVLPDLIECRQTPDGIIRIHTYGSREELSELFRNIGTSLIECDRISRGS